MEREGEGEGHTWSQGDLSSGGRESPPVAMGYIYPHNKPPSTTTTTSIHPPPPSHLQEQPFEVGDGGVGEVEQSKGLTHRAADLHRDLRDFKSAYPPALNASMSRVPTQIQGLHVWSSPKEPGRGVR